jgi:hypothetical protein
MTQVSTKTVRKDFENAIETAFRIYAPARHDCVWNYESINEGTFHPRVAYKVVGLAFLSIVAAWEEYLENSFLRYMAGAKSESSYSPKLRIGKCKNTTHSIQALTGAINSNEATKIMRWSDYSWALTKAEIYFNKAEPYSKIPSLYQERIRDAQIIRNRIAHSSLKARNQFKKMANINIGNQVDSPMAFGFSPGKYLIYTKPEIVFKKSWIDSKDCEWPDIFECYMHMFIEIIDIITPCNN